MRRHVFVTVAALAGLTALGAPGARAQAEIDPDHFELSNMAPFDKAKTDVGSEAGIIRYEGEFRLPYAVQCSGKSLRPGRYSVSVRSDGKIARATVNQGGRATAINGVVQEQARPHESDALVVEREGATRRLSAIQIAKLDFVFDATPRVSDAALRSPKRIERLPLTKTIVQHD